MKYSYVSLKSHLSYSPVLRSEARTLCILSKFSVAEMHPQRLSVCPDPSIVAECEVRVQIRIGMGDIGRYL